jgi:hypothetical protein
MGVSQVGDEDPVDVEGPITHLELGLARGDEARERALLLRRHLDEIVTRLGRPDLHYAERHELSDAIERLWTAAHEQTAEPLTRIAMRFLEALDHVKAERPFAATVRCLACEEMGAPPFPEDAEMAEKASPALLERAENTLANARAKGEVEWLMLMPELVLPRAISLAQRIFSHAHAGCAAKVTRDEWIDALDAWERGPDSPRKGRKKKWDVLSEILRRIGVSTARPEFLADQWAEWLEGRFLTPLYKSGEAMQVPVHAADSTQPSPPKADP